MLYLKKYLTHHWEWCSTPIKLVTMLYVIPDTLLIVALNTNKTGQHVICYIWHIIESGIKHEWNCSPCYTLYLAHCWEWRSTPIKLVTMLYMTCCWTWRSTPIKLATMLYAIHDILLKVAFNTNKTGYHVIRYTWHIVESGVQQQ